VGVAGAVDAATFDLSPEDPMGGMASVGSTRRLWVLVATISAGFLALAVLIVMLTVVLR
jgi:hypothetical protein